MPSQCSKANLNKYVFDAFLNDVRQSISRILAGKLFQSFGVADWKALSPSITKYLPVGGNRVKLLHDLKLYLECLLIVIRSVRYFGANPCIHLKVNNKI